MDDTENGILPEDDKQVRIISKKSKRFVWKDGYLWRISYTWPLLKCVGEDKVKEILEEIHELDCGSHAGTKNFAYKSLWSGYYLPTNVLGFKKICGWLHSILFMHSSKVRNQDCSYFYPPTFCSVGNRYCRSPSSCHGAKKVLDCGGRLFLKVGRSGSSGQDNRTNNDKFSVKVCNALICSSMSAQFW